MRPDGGVIEVTTRRAVELARDPGQVRSLLRAREAFLETGRAPGGIREEILASWRRSWVSGVVPDRPQLPHDSDHDHSGRLKAAARPVLRRLAHDLDGTNTSLLLTDCHGWILDRWVGSGHLMECLDRNQSIPGYSLNEQHAGTNGLGTVLEVGRPVQISGPEHFADQYQTLTCAGAPIRHPLTRQLEGVIDLTCPFPETNTLMLPFVVEAAAEIERRLYMQVSTRERLLLEEFLSAAQRSASCVMAMNESVVIASPGAARLLEGLDQMLLWERVAAAVRSGAEQVWELEATDGHVVRVRCHAALDGSDLLGAVLRVDPDPSPRPARPRDKEQPGTLPELAGRSASWHEVVRLVCAAAGERTPCLVEGEPGVGKLAAARAIHSLGGHHGQLTVVDASGACVVGTQAWLQAIDDRLHDPAGTLIVRHLEALDDVTAGGLAGLLDQQPPDHGPRLIATRTTGEVPTRPALGGLLDRLRLAVIEIPPLRERIDDLPGHVEAFTTRYGKPHQRWRPEAIQALSRLDWPGNVRELESVVRRSLLTCQTCDIGMEALPADVLRRAARRPLSAIEQSELDTIVRALKQAGGNKVEAATTLGMARSTLYRKLRQYGIDLDHMTY